MRVLLPVAIAGALLLQVPPARADGKAEMDAAIAAETAGDSDKALGHLQKALASSDLAPNWRAYAQQIHPIILSNRGNSRNKLGRYEQAIADQTEALKLNPKFANAYAMRGNSLFHLRKTTPKALELALADYDQAIALDGKTAYHYTGRGEVHTANGDYDKALADFTQAQKLDPASTDSYVGIGLVAMRKNEPDRALAAFDQGFAASGGKDSRFAALRGNVYRTQGKHDKALAEYEAALKLKPDDAFAFYGRGLVKRAKGDEAGATADLVWAQGLSPDVPETVGWKRESPREYTAGMLAMFAERFPEAIRHFKLGAEVGDPGCALQLAYMTELGQGTPKNREEAARWLDQATADGRLYAKRALRYNFDVFKDLAQRGYSVAQYAVGRAYVEANDGDQPTGDMDEARHWLGLASQSGHAGAANLLNVINQPPPSNWDRVIKDAAAAAQARITQTNQQVMATLYRQHQENCAAAARGAARPCKPWK